MKILKKISLTAFCISAFAVYSASAQEILNPKNEIKNRSFAIIVDQETFNRCKNDIIAYQNAIEKEGLPTFIIANKWNKPEEVKEQILNLYKTKKLEGVVFVGDIPIPMIRKAQQLATAFKMDESYDIKDSSIPSDRFYDDFDLTFNYLEKDKKYDLLYYYDLGINSANKIQADIYSARIKPITAPGKDKYQQVSSYLQKVIKAKQEQNPINNIMAYLGDGTLSNSLTAWSPELYHLEEQFPNTFKKSTQAQVLRFDTWDFPKAEIVNQLKRNDLDIAFIHEHGVTDRMYISGEFATKNTEEHHRAIQRGLKNLAIRNVKNEADREKFLKNYLEKYNLSPSIIAEFGSQSFKEKDSLRYIDQGINANELDAISPNVKLTIFDACYNGDLREDDYIAGRFIFSDGQSLLALANSVSILQDVNTPHLIGTLGMGINLGRWAQYNHVLESHVFGDPTFVFTPNTIENINTIPSEKDNNKLLEALAQVTTPEAKNLILTQLYWNNYPELAQLLEQEYMTSNNSTTRYTCLHLTNLLGGEIQLSLLKKGSTDTDEFIRRHSINVMSTVGEPSLIPYIVQAYIDNQHASRVLFSIKMSLYSFDQKLIKASADELFDKANFVNKEVQKNNFYKDQFSGFYADIDKEIFDPKSKYKKLSISALRNVNYHPSVDKYLSFVSNDNEDLKLRIAMLESLAWFGNSYRKPEIIATCQTINNDTTLPQSLRDEALRTINKIK